MNDGKPCSSSEAEPLMPGRSSHHHQSFKSYIRTALIAIMTASIAIIIFASVFNTCNDPLDPDVRDRIRKDWDIELRQHQKETIKRIDTQKRWLQEDNDRILEERQKHEEEERLRLNMFWTNLASHTCTTYATREYTARLVNVPSYYNRRVEACMATPIKIHGTEYMPKWCEDYGPNNVIGHWEVDQHEPDCAPYWSWYKDFGCVSPGSGQRRIEHYLENLPLGGDWKEFCATAPVSFRGMHFIGAEFCFQKNYGTYGHWVFDDESCK
ncbi:hypothetical protein BDR03DRAFT_1091227 [Suillus americanus]|nr:hypothetical protein BDR03DRAFT_1091227 [Suillus americanus]